MPRPQFLFGGRMLLSIRIWLLFFSTISPISTQRQLSFKPTKWISALDEMSIFRHICGQRSALKSGTSPWSRAQPTIQQQSKVIAGYQREHGNSYWRMILLPRVVIMS
ncbi:uncharacterized protein EV420DRAFT_1555541 [Desarmillaria tabescens]|uniref:Uncharacterized protein n=1 Tax=Armillaria tabescens TaxID=1929756 RepID=A0AA39N1P7_ARMTA|nr:uncharacterized protein EV420DRAFT_1555541 [Desarmillaria tabescens]KAK0454159.1 hypothetical protein EV420DRAFT_1555541 [Desarmillaria tabescens]